MKNILKFIKDVLFYILLIPISVIAAVCLIIYIPIDYIRYKKSHYYKDFRKKYRMFGGVGTKFKLYNEIREHNIPIEFISDPKEDGVEQGIFVYNCVLIIPDCFENFRFDPIVNEWCLYCDGEYGEEAVMTLDEYIEEEIECANNKMEKQVCSSGVILSCSDDDSGFADNEKTDPRILIYSDNRPQILKNWCNMRKITD